MRLIGLGMALAGLAACGSEAEPPAGDPTEAPPAAAPKPDLAACPKAQPAEELQRTAPIPVPAAFHGLAASSMDHFAFTTLEESTVCVDTTWVESIDDAELSEDGRFASFSWAGYEAFGHVIVDRTGQGQVLDTGNPPVASPSGRRLAAADLSESAFGSLNAFAVWEIRPSGLRQIAEQNEGFPSGDWRIEGWQGDACVRLSVVPLERQPEDYREMDKAPRDPWFAAQASGWRPAAGSCPAS